jgi:hypothetical protein
VGGGDGRDRTADPPPSHRTQSLRTESGPEFFDAEADGKIRPFGPAVTDMETPTCWLLLGIGRLTRISSVLFSDRASKHKLLEAERADRENLLEMLIGDFRKAFPELTFELQTPL